ncbi:MAG: Gfo/Idh/MocA family oxidoreductase, partial [Planctomycetota bacterium]
MPQSNLDTPAPAVHEAGEAEAEEGGRTLRCGVIGVGRMGTHHARLYTEIQGAELVGVVDTNPRHRDQARQTWGV